MDVEPAPVQPKQHFKFNDIIEDSKGLKNIAERLEET